ncbi:MAG: formylglycine-generating enzyme family protein, partial [Planctomycetota bacterium]|nr:formylglycine-generating enzyme family protein [Planctomycetota bacterium]
HVKTGLVLHLVPGGAFQMGSQHGLRDELPLLPLKIGAFLLGQWPLLNSEWQSVSPDYFREGLSYPRSGISWYEARVWLTKAGGRLRLPSESEWEYACRGAVTVEDKNYYWGHDYDGRYCWCLENSGGKKHDPREHLGYENQMGLIDLSGNVWEWCDDLYKDYRSGQPYPEDVPLRLYPLRGGSYKSVAEACGSTRRLAANVRQRQIDFGLRVARSLPPGFC